MKNFIQFSLFTCRGFKLKLFTVENTSYHGLKNEEIFLNCFEKMPIATE